MSDETTDAPSWQDELRFRYGWRHAENEVLFLIHSLMPPSLDRETLAKEVEAMGFDPDGVSEYLDFLEQQKRNSWESFGKASCIAMEQGDSTSVGQSIDWPRGWSPVATSRCGRPWRPF